MANIFPEELIQEVAAANDIVDIIGGYVQLKKAGSRLVGLCPFHKEKTPSFSVSTDKQLYHCFGCGVGGTVINFVMSAENLDFVEALHFLADRAKINLPEGDQAADEAKRYQRKQELLQFNKTTAKFFVDMLHNEIGGQARSYIAKRGVSDAVAVHFGMGFAPDDNSLLKFLSEKRIDKSLALEAGVILRDENGKYYDRFRNRLMIPIIDIRGNVVGFGGRALGDAKAKYMNSPESSVFLKRRIIYALNYAKNAGRKLILVEGYMDVISLHQSGFNSAIASMGTALTFEQAKIINKYADEVYICYDTDEAGKKATDAAIEVFDGLDIKVKVISLPQGKDPDEYIKANSKEAFSYLLDKAQTVVGYKLGKERASYNLDDINQKIDFVNASAKVLSSVRNSIERETYVKELAFETGVSEEAIMAEVKKRVFNETKYQQRPVGKTAPKLIPPQAEGLNENTLKAERLLLNLIAVDSKAYNSLHSKIDANILSSDIHRRIFEKIVSDREKGQDIDLVKLISSLPQDDAGEAALVFADEGYEDSLKAAHDALIKIEINRLEEQISIYTKQNDFKKVMQLTQLKAQKLRKEGLRNE